jgi:hypothetical protein
MNDVLPKVASLVGSSDALVGFAVHMAIGAGAGLLFVHDRKRELVSAPGESHAIVASSSPRIVRDTVG